MLSAQPAQGKTEQTTRSTSKQQSAIGTNLLVAVCLIGIMLFGAFLRFDGTNWDDYVHFHPDERFLVGTVGTQMGRGWLSFTDGNENEQMLYCMENYRDNNGVGGFFDAKCSDMNPHNIGAGHFAYGTFPAFTARAAALALNDYQETTMWTSYDGMPLVWRTLSAIYDTVSLFLVFLIGLKLHDKWIGLLAVLLYAAAVLPIQIAHFATADAMTAMWVTFSLYFTIRAYKDGNWLNWALAGIGFGAALGSRFNVFPFVIVIIYVAIYRMMPMFDAHLTWHQRRKYLIGDFGGLVLAGITTVIVFRLVNPYAFEGPSIFGIIPNHRWLDDLMSARRETSSSNSAPPNWQWTGRAPYLFAWQNIVLWGMGFALGLAGWFAWGWALWRWVRDKTDAWKNAPFVIWILVYFGWVGGNFVMSMRYYLPLYSSLIILASWMLVTLVRRAYRHRSQTLTIGKALSVALLLFVAGFTVLWSLMFTNIYRSQATFVQAGYWVWENSPGDFYMMVDGAPEGTPLMNIPIANTLGQHNDLLSNSTRIFPDTPHTQEFTATYTGTISAIHAPRIGAMAPNQGTSTLRFTITAPETGETLSEALLTDEFVYDEDMVGISYSVPLDSPLYVVEGQPYRFTAEVIDGQGIATTGSVYTWEGYWVEAVPVQVCALPDGMTLADNPPPGLYMPDECRRKNASSTLITTNQFDLTDDDDENKRSRMVRLIDTTDYIIIGSNRRYDANSRLPMRWPMTLEYYDALFSGELGFELVASFEETFEWGPFRVSDQYLPTYDAPEWLNEFEAEEAFHVYDHPTTFIFKKTADYSAEKTREIFYNVSLDRPPLQGSQFDTDYAIGVIPWSVEQADQAPTAIQFTDEMQEIQETGGTFSDRFNRDSLINTQPIITVIAWYLGLIVLGLVVFPYLFFGFRALSDRGYAVSKIIGMLVVGWLAWFASSARVQLWSPEGIRLIVLVMAIIAGVIYWRNRDKFGAFWREQRRLILITEAITLFMFIAFVFVRLSNPDLWTTGFGGEKPMDFAYFNGVLRSTIFPAIDPWFAGGYLNYYYFGFVIVGTPTLLLGVLPSIAYNLIVPTLFAATGIGAFSLAYSVVDRSAEKHVGGQRRRLGNAYLAGVAALLLASVLGNLDTPRIITKALAQHGGYAPYETLAEYLIWQYTEETGFAPQGQDITDLFQRGENSFITDRLPYEMYEFREMLSSIGRGIGRLYNPEDTASLPIGTDRWFWAPSRVIGESVGGNAITEMPYFTFIYGDMHAHMITMPLILFALAFVFNEVMLAGREQRKVVGRVLATLLGALTVGMFIATNSWEYPTFMLFSVIGLGYAWWLRWRDFTLRAFVDMFLSIGGFLLLTQFVAMPYTQWFATAYSSFRAWEGTTTPLWAYFQIYGLFLFLIVSLLIWETARWMRSVRVISLRGRRNQVYMMFGFVGLVLLGSLIIAMMGYHVALIVLPLVVWIAVLFFRPGQSVAMQYILVLIGLGLSITMGVEVIVLDGDIGRQNTVFKFYMQVWLMLSVVGGAAVSWLVHASDDWGTGTKLVWYTLASTLFFVAALFPVTATPAKSVFRLSDQTGPVLDGAKFMENAVYFEEGAQVDMLADYNTIKWLQDNIEGSPTIIEAHSAGEYKWGGRISIHTGLPSVLGWNWHQRQQRTLEPLPDTVWQRTGNINRFYTTTSVDEAWRLILVHDIDYVIVSGLERALYGIDGGLEKFGIMEGLGWLEAVYQEGNATVYKVNHDANPDATIAQVP